MYNWHPQIQKSRSCFPVSFRGSAQSLHDRTWDRDLSQKTCALARQRDIKQQAATQTDGSTPPASMFWRKKFAISHLKDNSWQQTGLYVLHLRQGEALSTELQTIVLIKQNFLNPLSLS